MNKIINTFIHIQHFTKIRQYVLLFSAKPHMYIKKLSNHVLLLFYIQWIIKYFNINYEHAHSCTLYASECINEKWKILNTKNITYT